MKIIHKSNESGFTLIELLIAMTLLLFGIISFVKFSGNMVNKNGHQLKRTVATSLAAEKLEDLKNWSTDATKTISSSDDGTDTLDLDGNTGGAQIFTRTWAITGTADDTNIVVTVTWDRRGNTVDTGYGTGKLGVTLQTKLNQG